MDVFFFGIFWVLLKLKAPYVWWSKTVPEHILLFSYFPIGNGGSLLSYAFLLWTEADVTSLGTLILFLLYKGWCLNHTVTHQNTHGRLCHYLRLPLSPWAQLCSILISPDSTVMQHFHSFLSVLYSLKYLQYWWFLVYMNWNLTNLFFFFWLLLLQPSWLPENLKLFIPFVTLQLQSSK